MAKSTLVITDSHGEGAFGAELVKNLEAVKNNVYLYAVGGSSAADWDLGLPQPWGFWEYQTGSINRRGSKPVTPLLKDLIKKFNPDRVIIELGTNLIWRPISSKDSEHIQNLIQSVRESGAECFWIGLPDLRRKSSEQQNREVEIQQLLEKEVEGSYCQLIYSWRFTLYPESGGDGIHYDEIPLIGQYLAKEWAIWAFQMILSKNHLN